MLVQTLRERLFLTGAKVACEEGRCGSCTIHLNGHAVNSCIVLTADADGAAITTIEGLADGDELHVMQQAFIDGSGLQCGYCTPGMIMAAISILEDNPDASESEIRCELSGNICRCTGYKKIIESVQLAQSRMKSEKESGS
jgi:carbon-monoxide dehydrogenase small subunit